MSSFKYADVLASVSISKGVARLDFGLHIDPEDESLEGVESVSKVCLPLDGLIRMYNTLSQVVERLQEDGVLVKQDNDDSDATLSVNDISKN
jgi:hypothetical protein